MRSGRASQDLMLVQGPFTASQQKKYKCEQLQLDPSDEYKIIVKR